MSTETIDLSHLTPNVISEKINKLIVETGANTNLISDSYHTFKYLYEFRKTFNAALFNEWAKQGKYETHKSWKHADGLDCYGGGWFIVVAVLPSGQISNHYPAKDWDSFKIEELPQAKYEWDSHTPQNVLERIAALY